MSDTARLLDPEEPASATLALEDGAAAAFADALGEGRGVVFVAAHLGPWERMAALLAERGFPVATIAREANDPRMTALYERIRAPRGVRAFYRGRPGVMRAVVQELAAGRAVGFLVDLPARVSCSRMELFGALADIPLGPARVALARGAAVIVGTCIRPVEVGGTARVRLERVDASDLSRGARGELALLERIVRVLELRIASWPEAWLGLFVPPRLPSAELPR